MIIKCQCELCLTATADQIADLREEIASKAEELTELRRELNQAVIDKPMADALRVIHKEILREIAAWLEERREYVVTGQVATEVWREPNHEIKRLPSA